MLTFDHLEQRKTQLLGHLIVNGRDRAKMVDVVMAVPGFSQVVGKRSFVQPMKGK